MCIAFIQQILTQDFYPQRIIIDVKIMQLTNVFFFHCFIWWLKSEPIYDLTVLQVRSPGGLNWALCLGSDKAQIKMLVRLGSSLEALEKNMLPSSFRLFSLRIQLLVLIGLRSLIFFLLVVSRNSNSSSSQSPSLGPQQWPTLFQQQRTFFMPNLSHTLNISDLSAVTRRESLILKASCNQFRFTQIISPLINLKSTGE